MTEIGELGAAYGGRVSELIAVSFLNAGFYSKLWGGSWLPPILAAGTAASVIGVVLFSFCFLGMVRILRRGWEPSMIWLACGAGMHLLWPWQYERYLLNFIPMLAWCLFEGLEVLISAALPLPALSRQVLTGALVVQFIFQGRHLIAPSSGRSNVKLEKTYAWIKENIPQSQALAGLYYSRDSLHTQRLFAPLPEPASPKELAQRLRQARICCLLIQDDVDFGSSIGQRFAPAQRLKELKSALSQPPFRVLYADPGEGSVIYSSD